MSQLLNPEQSSPVVVRLHTAPAQVSLNPVPDILMQQLINTAYLHRTVVDRSPADKVDRHGQAPIQSGRVTRNRDSGVNCVNPI